VSNCNWTLRAACSTGVSVCRHWPLAANKELAKLVSPLQKSTQKFHKAHKSPCSAGHSRQQIGSSLATSLKLTFQAFLVADRWPDYAQTCRQIDTTRTGTLPALVLSQSSIPNLLFGPLEPAHRAPLFPVSVCEGEPSAKETLAAGLSLHIWLRRLAKFDAKLPSRQSKSLPLELCFSPGAL